MRINIKLTIYVGIIAAIATLILAYTSNNNILKSTQQENDRIIQALVATVYDTAAISAYLNNEALANDVVTGLLKNQRVLCASIITPQMSTAENKSCIGGKSYSEDLFSPFNKAEKIGQITIFKNEALEKQLASEIANNKIQGVIFVVVISILVTLVTTYLLVSHPIEKLAAWLDSVKLDNAQSQRYPHTNRNDEIGKIGFKINQLLNKLDERLNKERALTEQTKKLSDNFTMICNLSKNALIVTDDKLNLLSYNPTFESLWKKYSGHPRIHTNTQWLGFIFENSDTISNTIMDSHILHEPTTLEIESKHKLGQDKDDNQWFELTFAKAENMQGELSVFMIISDVTSKRQQLLKSEFEADHDILTNLKNRRAARRMLSHLLQTPDQSSQVALLVIDLDGFKDINDTYGHDAGDTALIEVAKRLAKITRRADILARWGGDEFIIALNYSEQKEAELIAEKAIQAISQPIYIEDQIQVELGASIGISMSPSHADDFDTLFEKADQAMYQVKKQGKNSFIVFNNSAYEQS
ncbi:GGDEF domain-containing protein [Catenovulum sp. 2E275]|uniref:GGDEF domain-containing protein n=1 Tax=Catenovulum sp. 2E275 TaxID=2980497 RepID=UPI0021D05032|nr:GGDEF domain-containing protein [Catenovulum sp. 2E275]MCU4674271.1 GGDEF domain-containing protein [Catenovulum sp. 2E275]